MTPGPLTTPFFQWGPQSHWDVPLVWIANRRSNKPSKQRTGTQHAANNMNTTLSEKELYQPHETQWKYLNAFAVLRWETPWPIVRRPKSAEDIKKLTIHAYSFAKWYWPENNSVKTNKDWVKSEHIKRWHPDEFNNKHLPKIIEEDKGVAHWIICDRATGAGYETRWELGIFEHAAMAVATKTVVRTALTTEVRIDLVARRPPNEL